MSQSIERSKMEQACIVKGVLPSGENAREIVKDFKFYLISSWGTSGHALEEFDTAQDLELGIKDLLCDHPRAIYKVLIGSQLKYVG